MARETLVQEFSRLIQSYNNLSGSAKAEAWNLIADFAIENSLKICLALERTFSPPADTKGEG